MERLRKHRGLLTFRRNYENMYDGIDYKPVYITASTKVRCNYEIEKRNA